MRRANDLPFKKLKIKEQKENDQNKENSRKINNRFRNQVPFDILMLFSKFDRRIKKLLRIKKFVDNKIFGVYKKSYERCILYNERLPFSFDLEFFINLEIVIIKNSSLFDFSSLNCRSLKTLYISNCEEVSFTDKRKQIRIEEIYLKNLNIDVFVLHDIIDFYNPISLNLNRVNVVLKKNKNIEKLSCTENSNGISTLSRNIFQNNFNSLDNVPNDSNVFVNQDFNDNVFDEEDISFSNIENYNVIYLDPYENQSVNSIISSYLNKTKLKSITSINTNIDLNTFTFSKKLYDLNSFTFVKDLTYLIFAFSNSVYNFLEVNIPQTLDYFDFRNLEMISFDNLSIFFSIEIRNLKCLKIFRNKIEDSVILKIHQECPSILEIFFIDCYFSSNSFYKFVDLFCSKLKILSLKNSVLPLDSLAYIKTKFKNCKVIFKDGSHYNIENYTQS